MKLTDILVATDSHLDHLSATITPEQAFQMRLTSWVAEPSRISVIGLVEQIRIGFCPGWIQGEKSPRLPLDTFAVLLDDVAGQEILFSEPGQELWGLWLGWQQNYVQQLEANQRTSWHSLIGGSGLGDICAARDIRRVGDIDNYDRQFALRLDDVAIVLTSRVHQIGRAHV
jgi:hypothetical protein